MTRSNEIQRYCLLIQYSKHEPVRFCGEYDAVTCRNKWLEAREIYPNRAWMVTPEVAAESYHVVGVPYPRRPRLLDENGYAVQG